MPIEYRKQYQIITYRLLKCQNRTAQDRKGQYVLAHEEARRVESARTDSVALLGMEKGQSNL